jgi:hypothetical protein
MGLMEALRGAQQAKERSAQAHAWKCVRDAVIEASEAGHNAVKYKFTESSLSAAFFKEMAEELKKESFSVRCALVGVDPQRSYTIAQFPKSARLAWAVVEVAWGEQSGKAPCWNERGG